MRTLEVSDSTYAALWAKWQDGDEGEEGVIRRILGLKNEAKPIKANGTKGGWRDPRFGVEFPEGFEIFRTFKGQHHRAIITKGGWLTDNNRRSHSLNQLSKWIGAPTENAWMGWQYMDGGRERPIADLRDPSKVRRRSA